SPGFSAIAALSLGTGSEKATGPGTSRVFSRTPKMNSDKDLCLEVDQSTSRRGGLVRRLLSSSRPATVVGDGLKLARPGGTVLRLWSKRVRAIRFVLAMGEVAQGDRMAFFVAEVAVFWRTQDHRAPRSDERGDCNTERGFSRGFGGVR